ncbi:hypothetical protein RSAG8_06685, partial [Rhizoctonia solani AG-8 WAC10335]
MEAPTSFLPRIKRLDEYTAPQIHEFLTRLVTIYLPKLAGKSGPGTGLLSLLAGKLVERAGAATGKDNMNYTIIATDYHPAVLENLRANVQGNFPDSNTESDTSVDVRPLDWSLYLTGKPTTDLSRAPSTAPTPAVGTPVSGSGQNGIEPKTSATTLSTQGTSMPGSAVSPPIQTPSFSIASSVSTPTTSHSPQTPQTPRTARSPPPNLARAVFSRLVARGLKFEMPGGPPGVDQNSEQAKRSDSCPESPNLEDDFSAHSIDSVPITISVDPSVPSPDSDGPMIENDEPFASPRRLEILWLPELVCANLQDKTIVSSTSNAGNNYLTPCLDEIDALHCLVNEEMIFNTDEDQHPASSHTPVPGAQVIPIGDEVRSAHFEASNKVMCLWDDSPIGDSAVGTEAPPFKIAERADGPVHDWSLGQRQAPHMASPITASTYPLGELRTPNTIDSNIDTTEKPHPELPHANRDNDNPYNFMSSDSTNNTGRMSNCQASVAPADPIFDQPFDIILGADIVYELSHINLVRAGTGLLSLLAGKLVERAGAATGKDNLNYTIIATDYHPAVLENLRANVQGNFPDSNAESDTSVDVRPLDWSLYLTGKPTTDLSRAPSTAPTPAVGTPVSGSGQNGIEPKTSATTLSTQETSMPGSAVSPPIQTPSFSIASSVSTPTTSHSPQTPQTPRTARSPPPNLARAVFSRLVARGLKFEMPGGPPGIDQNSEQAKRSDSRPESPNLEDDFSAHSIDSVPITISVDPSVPSPDSDVPMIESDEVIETEKSSPPRTSSTLLPLDASRSELVCANLQDKTTVSSTSNAGNNYLTPCLDAIDALRCLVNEEMIFNTDEDQRPASSYTSVPGAQVIPIGDEVRSARFEASSKVMCLWNDSPVGDSAVGTEAPPFKIAERADGPVHDWSLGQRQAPHMASLITASTYPLGELRTPNTIDSNIDTTEKPHPELPHANRDNDNPYNFMSSDSTNNTGRMSNCQASVAPADPIFDQPFDIILGADIVYELSHINLVRGVVERLLRKPSYRLRS